MEVWLKDAGATRKLGEELAAILEPGAILILSGELGAGKTTLTQGLARGLGVTVPVTSPTFTLIQEYQGRYPLYHIDLYRLEDPEAMLDLGLEEYFAGEGITVVEWGERLEVYLPPAFLGITLEYAPGGRRALLVARGPAYERLLEELKKIVGPGG
ncbi:tRNA (adenosine(37)-N6)-threonylcarbamoyltransferase complex ATPase subunit type 1 TsaE [Moorella sp. Hama-1]|uniref:tRNA (adenosine(37)-N6)-threonylcarbamoyltransferase complex ATPase subunit type 1 TsaE n=1 Tax=Moorella sp. Hama-1 TaxID=2138101 RepID=UPI000D647D5F|nr:tRNA (adenosine(37)-N6)-threonylcarbamoyltransferase complex ATPase subunit type 1 TsaE [Moorella sp. Hama-1]BCV22717.1 tRNA (adenosine(37)-N6)-threonylcarbamoyltransferase complex ATPase subunit type 1 TsaE [Moorella sp. Hama-1]